MARRPGRPQCRGLKYRYTWTMPIVFSPHNPNMIYNASQYVFRSTDSGHSWQTISPDLTRNDKSKQQDSGGPITKDQDSIEFYDLIFTVAESPKERRVIWAGTDDGLIQLTRDDGKTWTNVTPKEIPEWSMVSLIEASWHDPGTAYIAVDGENSTISSRTFSRPPTSANPGRKSPPAYPTALTFTPFAKIPCARDCSSPERNLASTFPSTTAHTGSRCSSTFPPRPFTT